VIPVTGYFDLRHPLGFHLRKFVFTLGGPESWDWKSGITAVMKPGGPLRIALRLGLSLVSLLAGRNIRD
jgi:hypothetical protein